ncbi:MAG: hypothetical protein HY787_05755 [Deltaproteobacteria bacterium]|nr:hypothetical protein [Deltaproteobacteria bacterium]
MARVVPEIKNSPKIGRQILDIVTSGMYDNPLMIYREYIQNSADSIDYAIEKGFLELGQERISITLNGFERSIIIYDNGFGLPNSVAHSVLIDLGCSPKEEKNQRGFRGIGRLGGLAYCDELVFETRSSGKEDISIVQWNRKKLEIITSDSLNNITLQELIQDVVSLDRKKAFSETESHFFKVTLRNVHRFHEDMLLNMKNVYTYLSQNAPVSYNRQIFSHAEEIETYLSAIKDYRCYNINLNGKQIFKPYSDDIRLSTNISDRINGIEYFHFDGNNSTPIALGWYARTGLFATLPSALNVRGVRIRQGNIEIGGEHFLDEMFSEPRFSGWHIGEIHVLDGCLKPNTRRDGFEQSHNYERFLEQSSVLGRHLSNLCRKASYTRVTHSKIYVLLNQLEQIFDNFSTYIDKEHYEKTIDDARIATDNIKMDEAFSSDELSNRLSKLRNNIKNHNHKPTYLEDVLDGRKLNKYSRKSLLIQLAKIIIGNYGNNNSSLEQILQKFIVEFAKPNFSTYKLKGISVHDYKKKI